jgi:hypothetical protein
MKFDAVVGFLTILMQVAAPPFVSAQTNACGGDHARQMAYQRRSA